VIIEIITTEFLKQTKFIFLFLCDLVTWWQKFMHNLG